MLCWDFGILKQIVGFVSCQPVDNKVCFRAWDIIPCECGSAIISHMLALGEVYIGLMLWRILNCRKWPPQIHILQIELSLHSKWHGWWLAKIRLVLVVIVVGESDQCMSMRKRWFPPMRLRPTPPALRDTSITCTMVNKTHKVSEGWEVVHQLTGAMLTLCWVYYTRQSSKQSTIL